MQTPIAFSIRQFRRATCRAIQNGSSALIRVQSGVKRVQIGPRLMEVPAGALAVSEPTLRRHLAHEGTTFSALLADVRMGQALTLLQASDLSVNRIALDVGYSCA